MWVKLFQIYIPEIFHLAEYLLFFKCNLLPLLSVHCVTHRIIFTFFVANIFICGYFHKCSWRFKRLKYNWRENTVKLESGVACLDIIIHKLTVRNKVICLDGRKIFVPINIAFHLQLMKKANIVLSCYLQLKLNLSL